MIGNQENGSYNDGSKRFHSAVIGVGIPLFNKAQKLAIEAQRVNEKIAANNYQLALNNLNMQYKQYTIQYQNALKETDYFQNDGLKNAETILKTPICNFIMERLIIWIMSCWLIRHWTSETEASTA